MKITEKLLKQLGCTKVENRSDCWELRSRGYIYFFEKYKCYPEDSSFSWAFHVGRETFEQGWNYGHCVTDLEECFGMISEDMHEDGKRERSTEIRELLGIKTEGEYND